MPTQKQLLEQLIQQQKEDANKQLEIALETSHKLNKLEMFVYGDSVSQTKGVIKDLRETNERLSKLENLYKITKTKFATAFFIISFIITGAFTLAKTIWDYIKG